MKRTFLLLAVLGVASIAHAHPEPTLDIDALVWGSDAVVEGTVAKAHTRTYPPRDGGFTVVESADVRVERGWMGAILPGRTVLVGDLSLYSVGGGEGAVASALGILTENGKTVTEWVRPSEPRSLGAGDRAIFFLRDARRHPDAYGAAGFAALPSGIRMVRGGRVWGFRQWSNPGGYGETAPVSRAAFDAGFAASRARIAELKARLHNPPRAADRAFFARWKAARQSARQGRDSWGADQGLTQALDERLAQIARVAPQTR